MDFLLKFVCTNKYTQTKGANKVINVRKKPLFQFDIRCPCRNRKLMILNLSDFNKPQVSLLERDEFGLHNTEIKCHICKAFVAVDV